MNLRIILEDNHLVDVKIKDGVFGKAAFFIGSRRVAFIWFAKNLHNSSSLFNTNTLFENSSWYTKCTLFWEIFHNLFLHSSFAIIILNLSFSVESTVELLNASFLLTISVTSDCLKATSILFVNRVEHKTNSSKY